VGTRALSTALKEKEIYDMIIPTHYQLLRWNTLYIPGDEDDDEEGLLLPSSPR
jgi:hypothetical protein